MTGTILPKGNKKYKLSYMKNHERYNKTVTCDFYQEAEVFLASFITDINNGTYVKPCKMTLIDTTLDVYSHALTNIDRLASDTLEKCLYEDSEDEKIPSNPYTISTKKYTSKIKLSKLKQHISK